MRRLLTDAPLARCKSLLIHSGQTVAFAAVAVLAAAAAPGVTRETPPPAYGLRKLAIEARARAHKGVDIAAPKGTTVFTAAEGRIVRTGYDAGGYGNFIEVRHPNGLSTVYGHLSRIDVASGDAVTPGQRIGLVGSTGYSTGPHLHFEVRRNGGQVNPTKVMGRHFDVAVKAKA